MIISNLPVILLKGLILLPNNEIRLEFDNDLSKNIIDVSEMFHENMILVISSAEPLSSHINKADLSKIGVVSKIISKIELPNGKTRVIIKGESRAIIDELLNLNNNTEVLESIISNVIEKTIDEDTEKTLIKKLYNELDNYIKNVPYMSNSILNIINELDNLSQITDVVAPNLSINNKRLIDYLEECSVKKRSEMILEDIYKEEASFELEKKLDLKIKNQIDKNQKEYILHEKMKYIREELGEENLKETEVENLKKRIKKLNCPEKIKIRLNNELKRYSNLNSASPEVSIVRNYIDWLLELPWTCSLDSSTDLNDTMKVLNDSHYGLDKIKTRIIEYLAVLKMNPDYNSPIICLVGPPGVGKTSLAKSIAKSVNRSFVKMSVGGVNDEAEIVGHRRTYLGASPGRIIQSMKKAKTANPVFLIDEIDKMTKDIKGDPASALLDVLDPEQNKFFSDNYIEEDYDLSKVMFILTANSLEQIPLPLRDRLEIIKIDGYTELEKLEIAKNYILPKLINSHGLKNDCIKISDSIFLDIIRYYTRESGVRELERKIEEIIRKIITSNVLENKDINLEVTDAEVYLGKREFYYQRLNENEVGVVNGLAYTNYGGDVLPIEVNYYKGTGNLLLTGSLGDVMKESATIALSYIKSNYELFGINMDKMNKIDIHIHVPEGAVPKDGPSAGVALTTALISTLSNKKVDKTIAMTGEITLRGKILPIGGLKEKSMGAYRSGIKTVFIPNDNKNDLDDIPKEIKDSIKFVPVSNYYELYKLLVKRDR